MKAMSCPTCMPPAVTSTPPNQTAATTPTFSMQHHRRHGHGDDAHGGDVLIHQVVVGAGEAQDFMVGPGKSLHHAHAGQVFLHDRVQRIEPALHLAEHRESLA